ncbi:unnamed protein product [Phytophthora fragariaefolia]|uniref:Unnamed protein product n=1 Tax=Phytophthora fragariaefolia TaxID=1490495 RepID=A0A9W6XB88_9STRA|nr:unnamed protein product [Phytophthora fragariaefolia]
MIPSCPSGATVEKLISSPENKFQVDTQVFRPMTRLRTCQVRHVADQDATPSDDLSSLWSQKPRSLERANRSQDPGVTPVINGERAATKSSTWRSSIQEPSHSEKAPVIRVEETTKDLDTKRD